MNIEISGKSKLLCLLGYPASHSISPKMHTLAAAEAGLPYVYLAFDTAPEELAERVAALKQLGVRGFNLTMPHKEAILPMLDELSEASELCRSVNTVVNEDGRLVGHTTDGIGYMDSLRDEGYDIIGRNMTIRGCGGAARSIIAQAALDGVKRITVVKRNHTSPHETFKKDPSFLDAERFAERIHHGTDCRVEVIEFEDKETLRAAVEDSAILVNATPVGMKEDVSPVDSDILRSDLLVSDIIYHPPMTRLLKDAEAVGAKYINGYYMLMFQGAAAFKLWTGKDMPVGVIRRECFPKIGD